MDDIRNAIELLLSSQEAENKQKYAAIVAAIKDKYKGIKDIESFHALVSYQAEQAINQVMYEIFPESANRSVREAYQFWEDIYRFVGNLVESIRRDQGNQWPSLCCMDVGRFVANSFVRYCETNALPVFERTAETYWVPEFGTAEEWMEFCKSIIFLRYHRPERYLAAMSVMDQYRTTSN